MLWRGVKDGGINFLCTDSVFWREFNEIVTRQRISRRGFKKHPNARGQPWGKTKIEELWTSFEKPTSPFFQKWKIPIGKKTINMSRIHHVRRLTRYLVLNEKRLQEGGCGKRSKYYRGSLNSTFLQKWNILIGSKSLAYQGSITSTACDFNWLLNTS